MFFLRFHVHAHPTAPKNNFFHLKPLWPTVKRLDPTWQKLKEYVELTGCIENGEKIICVAGISVEEVDEASNRLLNPLVRL